MSNITLSLFLFALYFYFPLICIKGGVSIVFELKQNNPDRDGFLAIYFIGSFLISILLYNFIHLINGATVDWQLVIRSLLPPTPGADLVSEIDKIDPMRSGFFLIINYALNFFIGWGAARLVPESHITPWQRILKFDRQYKKSFNNSKAQTRADILTRSGLCYSGDLESIITNKDGIIDIITLTGNITRFDIKAPNNNYLSTEIPSYQMLFNNADISNLNIRHFGSIDGAEIEWMMNDFDGINNLSDDLK